MNASVSDIRTHVRNGEILMGIWKSCAIKVGLEHVTGTQSE